ncbi:MAG: 4'-phosphopantetheinyl transferase superfamily protein [Lachnospiraceae bacterium]|nr:4'-phosphopantetheinyl transferase superfamily protein [Lachnospiraceae bacterium]
MIIDLHIVNIQRQEVLEGVKDPGCFSDFRRDKILSKKIYSSKCLSAAAGIALDKGLRQFGLREKEVRFIADEHGKPCIDGHPEIIFNLSHSGEYAVAAFLSGIKQVTASVGSESSKSSDMIGVALNSKNESETKEITIDKPRYDIGADIEQISRVNHRIAAFMKNDVGFTYCSSTDAEMKNLCRRWTAREAFWKCIGTGISSVHEDFYLEKTESGNLKLCQNIYDGEFTVFEPEAPEGYCITYVVRRHG